MKRLTSSKTFWVNFLIVVAAGISGVMGTDVVTPQTVSFLAATVGFINIALRIFTNKPIKGI